MSTATGNKGTNWLGIIALVLICTILGSLGGTLAGGTAGYFLGQRAARDQVASAESAAPIQPRQYLRPQPIVPPQGGGNQWPEQMPLPGVNVWAQVESVVSGAPAEKAGVQAGDQITAVDGTKLTARRDLAQAIGSYKVGDQVELTLVRDGTEQRLKVTLGENPDNAGQPYLGLTYRMATGGGNRYPSS